MIFVPRTCTETAPDGRRHAPQPLAEVRGCGAYVLLGEPGAGKTEAFKQEAEASDASYIRARDFVTLSPTPGRQLNTLFIDGLDEMRAGVADGRQPLDAIRQRLDQLGRPSFRLSCREADWWGASDREALAQLAPDGAIAVFHLDPLTTEQAIQLLASNHGIADPADFLHRAKEVRLDALLTNPQTLKLLADAVSDGWPTSRAQTYDRACRRLASDPNDEHRRAKQAQATSVDELLDAAGHLCAVQLLAGLAGYALDDAAANDAHPALTVVGLGPIPLMRAALTCPLFVRGALDEQREPIHRSVAEYLGARYLTNRIEGHGLPLGRALALMTTEDGGVVTGLRGLHAWLAAHAPKLRPALIDHDPLGVVLYGDTRDFASNDKRRLFDALRREAVRYPWFRSADWTASPFGALATPDMVDTFRTELESPDRSEAQQSLVYCVLDALIHGEPLPPLADSLLAVIRDSGRWQGARRRALEARVRIDPAPTAYLELLEDIRTGRVEDSEDELAGELLDWLYPDHLAAAQLFDHLHPLKSPDLHGSYLWFWTEKLATKTPAADLPAPLDALVERKAELGELIHGLHFNRMTGALLARCLAAHGDAVEVPRLWAWLGTGLDKHSHSRLENEHAERISAWIGERPALYRRLLAHGLALCAEQERPVHCVFRCELHLYDATVPADQGDWYFEQADAAASEELRRDLFDAGVRAHLARGGHTPAVLEHLLAWVADHPVFQPFLDSWLKHDYDESRHELAQSRSEYKARKESSMDDWLRFFQEHRAAIEDGSAPPKVMHDVAMIYYGRYREAEGSSPIERLLTFLQKDEALAQAALAGLRRSLARGDLPSVAEIADLAVKGSYHFLRTACLAGAEEIYRQAPEQFLDQGDAVLEKLVAFHLSGDAGEAPVWFKHMVAERPALVADVLVAYATKMLKAGREHIAGIYPLAYDAAYAQVAGNAVPRLIESFPARAKKSQSRVLIPLLKAALKHMDRQALVALVERKTALPSLDAPQRTYWLATGLLIDPARYVASLDRHAGRTPAKAWLLTGFFDDRVDSDAKIPELPEPAMALLVRLLGPHCPAERPVGAFRVSEAMQAADLVRSLIGRLGGSSSDAAVAALGELHALKTLTPWHSDIRRAQESQRLARRETQFRHASAEAVVKALGNLQPANVADLAALALAHLRDLAREARDGNARDYRDYWNHQNGKLESPRHESDCRNHLLVLLRERLRGTGVDAQPETAQADATRADIGLSFGGVDGLRLPIEIKRDSRSDLWQGLRNRLINYYARDPGAESYGIYLVFWFGGKNIPTALDGGAKPRSAGELEARLTSLLNEDERHRIAVIVMDCAPPQTA